MASRGWVEASHRQGALALAAFVAALSVAPESHAAAPGYEVTVGVGESDNISLVPSGGKDQTIGVEGVDFTWHDQQSRLGADVDADLQYLQYLQHAYSNEVIGNLIGDLRGTLVPQMLFWDLADNFGQGRVNPSQAVTPANRENINYFSTGPELAVPLTATTLIDLTAGYAKTTYQVSPLDGDRISGGLSLLRKLSADTSVSINLRDTRIDYSNDVLNEDYSRQDAFVRFDTHGQRTVIGVDLGFSKLRDSISPVSGVLARLQLSRKVSAFSTVAFSFGHQYSDAADAFRLGQTIGGANLATQSVSQSGTPFTSDSATLAWNFQRSRTGLGLSLEYYKDAYQQPSTLDDKRTQVEAHLSRALSPVLQVGVAEEYFYQQFDDFIGTATQTTSSIQLTWRAGKRLSVMLDYTHMTRHSDVSSSDYSANQIWLTVGYGRPAEVPPGPATPPLPRSSVY